MIRENALGNVAKEKVIGKVNVKSVLSKIVWNAPNSLAINAKKVFTYNLIDALEHVNRRIQKMGNVRDVQIIVKFAKMVIDVTNALMALLNSKMVHACINLQTKIIIDISIILPTSMN
jgi:hypothetical protein